MMAAQGNRPIKEAGMEVYWWKIENVNLSESRHTQQMLLLPVENTKMLVSDCLSQYSRSVGVWLQSHRFPLNAFNTKTRPELCSFSSQPPDSVTELLRGPFQPVKNTIIHNIIVSVICFALQTMTDDKYEVRSCVPEAAIQVCSTKAPQLTLKITLSSLAMREEHSSTEEGIDSSPSSSLTPLLLCASCFGGRFPGFYFCCLTFLWQHRAEERGR